MKEYFPEINLETLTIKGGFHSTNLNHFLYQSSYWSRDYFINLISCAIKNKLRATVNMAFIIFHSPYASFKNMLLEPNIQWKQGMFITDNEKNPSYSKQKVGSNQWPSLSIGFTILLSQLVLLALPLICSNERKNSNWLKWLVDSSDQIIQVLLFWIRF